jgi:hypothetical protein
MIAFNPNRRRSLLALVGGVLLCASSARAQGVAEIELGMTIFKTTGNCASCHAWTGRGALLYDSGVGFLDPPPSLEKTKLDRAAMIELFSCGTPGGKMAQHLAEAWSDRHRCYGKTNADLAAGPRPPRAYTALTLIQIEALASYVAEVYQGKSISHDYCVKYHGPPARICDLLR